MSNDNQSKLKKAADTIGNVGSALAEKSVESVGNEHAPGSTDMTRPMGLGKINLYDDGGDVELPKDQHETAELQGGEKVLTPDQAAAYNAEHSETIHPATSSVELTPAEQDSQKKAQGVLGSALSPAPTKRFGEPGFDYNAAAGDMIQQDKEEAAKKGDLVGFGKAIINEKHFGEPNFDFTGAAKSTSPLGKINLAEEATSTSKREPIAAPSLSFKDKLKDYDRQIQHAMDMAAQTNDPSWQERADRLNLAKEEYQRQNPWGSANNHPGVLGKIVHVASKIGQIAGIPFAAPELELIPGTELNRAARRRALGQALSKDTADRIASEAEQSKAKIAEIGRTPEQITYNKLLKTINPATNKLYTEDEALQQVKGDEQQKEKESYINDRMKSLGETRSQATEAYYTMKAGTKPPNTKEAAEKNWLAAKGFPDTPANRDLARREMIREETDIKQKAELPYADQKIRLQNELSEAKAAVDRSDNKALARGEKLDELTFKEKQRHNARVAQMDAAQNALDSADTNMLAASIVPVLATMTETTAQGIKRLNPQELARFMPKSSGDTLQWFEANYDKLSAGQIPAQYQKDLRQLLNNLEKEEQKQNESNVHDINETFGEGATKPVVNSKSGRADKTKSAVNPETQFRRDPLSKKVQKSTDGGKTWQ